MEMMAGKSAAAVHVALHEPLLSFGVQVVSTGALFPVLTFVFKCHCAIIRPSLGTEKLAFHFFTERQILHSFRVFRAAVASAACHVLWVAHVCPTLYAPRPLNVRFVACWTDLTILATHGSGGRDLRAYAPWYLTWPAPLVGITALAIVARVAPGALAYATPRHEHTLL